MSVLFSWSDGDTGHGASFPWRGVAGARWGHAPTGLICRLAWPGSRPGGRAAPVESRACVRGIPGRCPVSGLGRADTSAESSLSQPWLGGVYHVAEEAFLASL
jgi:hypothetical protein